ncbi:hypothetical protein WJX73_010446 [Symbiochloris irregularis]|uniref:DNA mismatch repair proteins mutS family domain-containing protein n=1 Tax=Symbiochloris irregularis TaxID=706552 RepID=A0AAW1PV52_9CHLO
MTTNNELRIEGGRHMLTELVVDTCIPNDTVMAPDAGRIQVITGPNFSGKSCYAKQVGIIVLLAHIGSFVPAAKALVSAMLRSATSRSLCLIDEFGKGTLSNDGVGLLCATLRHFVQQEQPSKVIACTHYSQVLDERFLPRHMLLSFFTMNVLVDKVDGDHEEVSDSDIVFLYRLVPGYAAPSFASVQDFLQSMNRAVKHQ